jgi:hypothetical protein
MERCPYTRNLRTSTVAVGFAGKGTADNATKAATQNVTVVKKLKTL